MSGHVNEDRSKQRERYANAAEDEIFPSGFQCLVRAVNPDHEDGGQCCEFDRYPHQSDIVRDQSENYGKHQHLVHRMIKSEIERRQPTDLELVCNVTRAEDARCEADECRERYEYIVEVVDKQIIPRLRPLK